MVRLKDIAARAGVSVMTVSKVLRDQPDVSAATKLRIRQLAEHMGYVPDTIAQGLRTRKTKLFGLVVPTAADPLFGRVILAVEERAHALGYDLLFAHTLNQIDREEACLRRLLARRVDGVFVAPAYRLAPTAAVYDDLTNRGTPTVILGQPAFFCRHFSSVASDDVAGSYELTQHLLRLGHRRIAYLAGPPMAPWAQERLEGYRRALREAQLDTDDRLVFAGGSHIDDGEKAAAQMLAEAPKATAVLAATDLVAVGAADWLLRQGVRIPQDLSLAGFGNTVLSRYFRVPLTTVDQPKVRLGHAAVDAMQRLLAQGNPESQRLPTELIVRNSTEAPCGI